VTSCPNGHRKIGRLDDGLGSPSSPSLLPTRGPPCNTDGPACAFEKEAFVQNFPRDVVLLPRKLTAIVGGSALGGATALFSAGFGHGVRAAPPARGMAHP
jgi:hypothetical protein